ncbi:MAG: c-type cytochrome [Gemmatirosa sp.]
MPTMPTMRARGLVVLLALAGVACRDGGVSSRSAVVGGDAARGQRVIATYGCGGCHDIPGVPGASGRVGPALGGLAHRGFVAGSLPNDAETLVRWIRDPQALRPGTAMPDLNVGAQDARDIAAYLYADPAGGLGPPHLRPRRWLEAH